MVQLYSDSQLLLIISLVGEAVLLAALLFSSTLAKVVLVAQAPVLKKAGLDVYNPYPNLLPNFNTRRFTLVLLRIVIPLIMIIWAAMVFLVGINIKTITISDKGVDLAYPYNLKSEVHLSFSQISEILIGEAAQRTPRRTSPEIAITLKDGSTYSQTVNNVDSATLIKIQTLVSSQQYVKCTKQMLGGDGKYLDFEYGASVYDVSFDSILCK